MPFDDVDDNKRIFAVDQQDHVVAGGKTSDLGVQLGTCAAECSGQGCQIFALLAQAVNKHLGYIAAAAFAREVGVDVAEVLAGRGKILKPAHLGDFVCEGGATGGN